MTRLHLPHLLALGDLAQPSLLGRDPVVRVMSTAILTLPPVAKADRGTVVEVLQWLQAATVGNSDIAAPLTERLAHNPYGRADQLCPTVRTQLVSALLDAETALVFGPQPAERV